MKRKLNYSDYRPHDVVIEYRKTHTVTYLFNYENVKSNLIIDAVLDAQWRDIICEDPPEWVFGIRYLPIKYVWNIDPNWSDEDFMKKVPKKTESELAKIVPWINPEWKNE